MDYTDLDPQTKKYIRKSTYKSMSGDQQKIYLKCVKRLLRKLESTNEPEIHTNPNEFVAADMESYGNHIFSKHDNITLELDDKDKSAIKILVDGKLVAFVATDCIHNLRSKKHLLIRKVSFVKAYPEGTKLRLGYAGTVDEIAKEKELVKAYNDKCILYNGDNCPVM